jgi:hypothetical protein
MHCVCIDVDYLKDNTRRSAVNLIDASIRYFRGSMPWTINEASIKRLDEQSGMWVAEVTTRHLRSRGAPAEETFAIAVIGEQFYPIDLSVLPRVIRIEASGDGVKLYYDVAGVEENVTLEAA